MIVVEELGSLVPRVTCVVVVARVVTAFVINTIGRLFVYLGENGGCLPILKLLTVVTSRQSILKGRVELIEGTRSQVCVSIAFKA
jgi:hypothetical protein